MKAHRAHFTLAAIAAIAAIATIATVALALPVLAQETPLSPPAQANATIDGKEITVDYSSPRMRGRKIYGGLVPYGKVWRTGANAATTLTTESDVMLGSLHVPAGKYTLYTIPGEKEWTLIVSKQTGQWGTQYDEKQDLGRAPMSVAALAEPLEEMTIALRPTEGSNGTLAIEWESTAASLPIVVH